MMGALRVCSAFMINCWRHPKCVAVYAQWLTLNVNVHVHNQLSPCQLLVVQSDSLPAWVACGEICFEERSRGNAASRFVAQSLRHWHKWWCLQCIQAKNRCSLPSADPTPYFIDLELFASRQSVTTVGVREFCMDMRVEFTCCCGHGQCKLTTGGWYV